MGGLTEWHLEGHAPLALSQDSQGRELTRSTRDGFSVASAWDSAGQLVSQNGTGVGRQYDWSRAFEPKSITDTRWGTKLYDYDENGQIIQTTHGDGGQEGIGYTPDLNIAATTSDTDRFVNWQTTAAGVVKIAHGPRGAVVTIEHDACGRVIKRSVVRKGFRPQTWVFGWNAMDQMVSADCPDGAVWHYTYDPFGRRIAKYSKSTRHDFLWDGDVIARETVNGHAIDWFFEPGNFRPLARLENGQLSYVVTDHLGTPKGVVSAQGTLQWAADHDTWGSLRPKPNVASATSARIGA